jgi:uncharacterized protein YunC (DUF1805 family)
MVNNPLPLVEDRVIETEWGRCIGHRAQWNGGQYCALLTNQGIVGCGAYDVACLDTFGHIVAIARGTPEKPLVYPEDLFDKKIVAVTTHARKVGIREGMTGKEALRILLELDAEATSESP